MDIKKMKKSELQSECEKLGIEYKEDDINSVLRDKILSHEVVDETKPLEVKEAIVKEATRAEVIVPDVEEVEVVADTAAGESKTTIAGYYKVKGRWVYMDEFDSEEAVARAAKKKGSKVYKTE